MIEIGESARAIAEVAKAGGKISDAFGKGLDAGQEIGTFLSGSSLKNIPRSIVSILGGDWIIGKQVENIINIQSKIFAIAEEKNLRIDPATLPWRIKVECIRGMADEDDDLIQSMWARLIVNSTKEGSDKVDLDRIIIETIKKISPKAAVLITWINNNHSKKILTRSDIVKNYCLETGVGAEKVAMLIDHLTQLRCIQHQPIGNNQHMTTITALGRYLLVSTA